MKYPDIAHHLRNTAPYTVEGKFVFIVDMLIIRCAATPEAVEAVALKYEKGLTPRQIATDTTGIDNIAESKRKYTNKMRPETFYKHYPEDFPNRLEA